MKTSYRVLTAVFMILLMAGCGSESIGPPVFSSSILSNPVYDGDIQKLPVTGVYSVAQGNTQSVYAGVHPTSGAEYRAFLDFPLTGFGGVPANALITSAFLDIVINSITPQPLVGTLPIRIDLVAFQPPLLVGSDFDRTLQPALATLTVSPPISQSDFGRHVTIDVTSLLIEAQRMRLSDFQVRILEDSGFTVPGIIEINDTTGSNRSALAPLLQVTYY